MYDSPQVQDAYGDCLLYLPLPLALMYHPCLAYSGGQGMFSVNRSLGSNMIGQDHLGWPPMQVTMLCWRLRTQEVQWSLLD